MNDKQFYVYIMPNKMHTVLYTGITSDLLKRVLQHKGKTAPGFTSRYNVTKLVYYEILGDAYNAISREKQIKSWPRKKKIELINSLNPVWQDLTEKL